MTSLESMIDKTKKLGLYNVDKGTGVYNEIYSYGDVLQKLFDTIDSQISEAFVQTAVSYGLSNLESIWSVPYKSLSVEKRREMIIERFSSVNTSCNPKSLQNFLLSINFPSTYIEDCQAFTLFVNNGKIEYSAVQRKWITQQIMLFLPAHL